MSQVVGKAAIVIRGLEREADQLARQSAYDNLGLRPLSAWESDHQPTPRPSSPNGVANFYHPFAHTRSTSSNKSEPFSHEQDSRSDKENIRPPCGTATISHTHEPSSVSTSTKPAHQIDGSDGSSVILPILVNLPTPLPDLRLDDNHSHQHPIAPAYATENAVPRVARSPPAVSAPLAGPDMDVDCDDGLASLWDSEDESYDADQDEELKTVTIRCIVPSPLTSEQMWEIMETPHITYDEACHFNTTFSRNTTSSAFRRFAVTFKEWKRFSGEDCLRHQVLIGLGNYVPATYWSNGHHFCDYAELIANTVAHASGCPANDVWEKVIIHTSALRAYLFKKGAFAGWLPLDFCIPAWEVTVERLEQVVRFHADTNATFGGKLMDVDAFFYPAWDSRKIMHAAMKKRDGWRGVGYCDSENDSDAASPDTERGHFSVVV